MEFLQNTTQVLVNPLEIDSNGFQNETMPTPKI